MKLLNRLKPMSKFELEEKALRMYLLIPVRTEVGFDPIWNWVLAQ